MMRLYATLKPTYASHRAKWVAARVANNATNMTLYRNNYPIKSTPSIPWLSVSERRRFGMGKFYLSTSALLHRHQNFPSSPSYLVHLEQIANNNPDNPSAQHALYTASLRANRPDIVINRFELGRFASNQACEETYLRALRLTNITSPGTVSNTSVSSTPHANFTGTTEPTQVNPITRIAKSPNIVTGITSQDPNSGVYPPPKVRDLSTAFSRSGGSRGDPLHVILEESLFSTIFRIIKFLLSFGLSIWCVVVLLNLVFEGTSVLRRVTNPQYTEVRPELQKTRFSDVQGCDEAKEELQDIVDFLKNPEKFNTLGGKMPKGILLVGPPGTGKTLLARAVAGEAGVPFFYMSGSEFDEVYVGVGAKRIRELFSAARAKAPAIVFIDELDAIGGRRNERDAAYVKQTLNQLLTNLDGFDQNSGVIFLAATNLPQLLDKALTRPGRFDRNINVPLPDVRGRVAILKHHLRNIRVAPDVDPSVIARGTPGFSGAELENIVNQAAVHASKDHASYVTLNDIEWAKDRILLGAERRSAVILEKDRVVTAYHEGGHALVALLSRYADPLYKATIIPHGEHTLGVTFQLPEMDQHSKAKRQYLAQIDVCLAGTVAEELVYGPDNVTSGAHSDLRKATDIAYAMVTQMGMSATLGSIDLHTHYDQLSSQTRERIWDEVHDILGEARKRVTQLLTSRRSELDRLANALLEYECLNRDQVERVINGEKLELPHDTDTGTSSSTTGQDITVRDKNVNINAPVPAPISAM